jgi:hypothetical protein
MRHHGGVPKRTWIAAAVALGAAVLMAVAAASGGDPASCVPACDCETIGTGTIAQPANAWTAAVLAAAGIWIIVRGRVGLGEAIALIGVSAFAAHATVAGWAYRAEGAVLAGVAWGLAAHPGPSALPAAAVAAATAWWLPDPGAVVVAGIGVVVVVARLGRSIPLRFGLPALLLLGGGSVLRLLGDDGGPWCRPDAALPSHAVWHLLAAAGLILLAEGSPIGGTSPRPVLPFGPVLRPAEQGDDQER